MNIKGNCVKIQDYQNLTLTVYDPVLAIPWKWVNGNLLFWINPLRGIRQMSPGSDCNGLPKNKGKQRELDEEDCVDEDPIDCPSKNCETSRIGLQVRN